MGAEELIDPTGILADRLQELVEAMKSAPAVAAFLGAQERFQSDVAVMRLRAELQESYDAFQRASVSGEARQAMFNQVRERQQRVQTHSLVQEYVRTKNAAEAFLRQINQAISAIVGLDLATTARPAGGSC